MNRKGLKVRVRKAKRVKIKDKEATPAQAG